MQKRLLPVQHPFMIKTPKKLKIKEAYPDIIMGI